jgi:hypothetical protein
MRKLGLAIVAIAGCATPEAPTVGQQEQAVTAFHVAFVGYEAVATYYIEGAQSIRIDVGESRSSDAPADAFLFYEMALTDPTTGRTVYDYGFGTIPTSDVEITPAAAHVHTSTSVPGFTTQQCVYDSGWMCTEGTSGAIDVSWVQNGFETAFSSGTSRIQSPVITQHDQATFWSVTASATGDIVGRSFTTAYGNLYDTRQQSAAKTFTRNF